MKKAMARARAFLAIAFTGASTITLFSACGNTSSSSPTTEPARQSESAVQTTAPPQQRTFTTATLVAAGGALPDGVPEALRPPAGVDVLADAGAGALALRVGDQADAALNYYVGRLGANSYELVRLDDRNDGKPAVLFGDVREGGTITITGSGASTQLLVSVTQFPTTPTLPKPFAMPGGAFRFGYDVTNDVAHHHLFLPKYAKDDSINALSSAAQSAG